ncbi:MAG: glycosyltransferase family 2 protein [Patescibacteria group bacterium]|nr:glycosyltransferase family 2 protein [Patescibacteria group bacterium]
MQNKPFISVIIPCRNEEQSIGKVLDSLIANDYPKELLEIIIVDGTSSDRTKEIAKDYSADHTFIKVLDNPKKITPVAMNIGIKNSKGELITKTDAHSLYPKDYLSKCVKYLREYSADAVGGIAKATPSAPTMTARAITSSLSSVFGAGGSGFRTGTEKPNWADTAFGTCYKKTLFEKVGLFNENLVRSQDMELNLRIKNSGGKILLVPDIVIEYYPKSTFFSFLKHNFKDGIWAILPKKYGAPLFKLRHLIPLIFVLGLVLPLILSLWFPFLFWLTIVILVLYSATSLYFSARIAVKEKNLLLIPFLITAFTVRHFGYGIGSIVGFIKLILPQ